ncbi:hypothetical protein BDV25DRAFT_141754 [Aspergillus avenaceus]|uniref:Conserved oligomeric Golgi complex subunit 1 n=1 Tax=Aspergillus avenaceus TaxID=36643 RepID=A0A5N6TQQ8_ASPAV|nr:hypothetical protein BDV25DRAFT_141754 [Aspergillus avenaceus]
MAMDGPDPQSLKSWQDAFQYPIPTVRRVEQELRRDIASNKEKLRALVGTRYRELVGTAETIVSMNQEMQEVDATLADIGRRCNPRLMEKKYTHFNQIKGDAHDKDAARRAVGAQLALLHRCETAISRLLRRRGSLLLGAKLVVISRLLHKALSQQKTVPPFLESLRNQIASLRQTLLRRVNKYLASASSTVEDIIEVLASYCLATSSSSDDAIRHFHRVREEVIESQLGLDDTSGENIPKALKLYISTLQISKTLLTRRLSDALSKLKARPVLTDPDIRNFDDLGLDVLGRWVPQDVSNFTPWIKLSELSKSDTETTLKKWSKQAFEKFSQEGQKSLANWQDFQNLLSLRERTLEVWLKESASTITHSSLQVLEGIRNMFNGRLTVLLSDQAKSLGSCGQDVAHTLSVWDDTEHADSPSLWDQDLMALDYSNGADAFKRAIADRLLGRDEEVSTMLMRYHTWRTSIEKSHQSIDELRQVRWVDVLEDGEDEDLNTDITSTLSEDDPQFLREALRKAVKDAYLSLQSSFHDTFEALGKSNRTGKAAFMLRIIRLVRRDLPADLVTEDFTFSELIVPWLQEMLATELVSNTPSLHFPTKLDTRVPGRSLWEGDPALPIQPSPYAFKFLRRLLGSMDGCGPGLWDACTVKVLKEHVQKELSGSVMAALESLESTNSKDTTDSTDPKDTAEQTNTKEDPTNPEPENQPPNETQDPLDRKIQLYFDTIYLQSALSTKPSPHNPLADAVEKLRNNMTSNDQATKTTERAVEYWKRTQLLFGLLTIG